MRPLEVCSWAENKPNVIHFLDVMNQRDIDWALFSGTVARPVTSSDVDILVSPQGFDRMSEIVPPGTVKRDVFKLVTGGDGEHLGMLTDEIVYPLDGTEIQALRPSLITNLTEDSQYFISLTETAKAARRRHRYHGTDIYEADIVDTLLIKSVFQRGTEQHKSDAADIQRLAGRNAWNANYAAQRASEINFDPRADVFLWENTGFSALSLAGIDSPTLVVA